MTDIIPVDHSAPPPLIPHDASDNQRKHLARFEEWLAVQDMHYLQVRDLKGYVAWLERQGLRMNSIGAYLSAARERMKSLASDNALRDALGAAAPGESFADQHAYVEEVVTRMLNVASSVKIKHKQVASSSDQQNVRLEPAQFEWLLEAPFTRWGDDHPRAWRDAALLAMMAGTGLREDEAANVTVEDMRHTLKGYPALLVREGKGNKQRVVPWGEREWWHGRFGFFAPYYLNMWMSIMDIHTGPVLRGFTSRHYTAVSDTRLDTSSIRRILSEYMPLPDGVVVAPHDLRRMYGKWMFNNGMSMEAIADNLGHASTKTTKGYVGEIDVERRVPGGAG